MTDNNGLYYMRARYYNPIIKRFMNADVLAGNIVDAGSLNRYAYVNGNPISYIDPFGLCADTDRAANGLMKIITGVIIAVGSVLAIVATVLSCGLDIPFLIGLGLLADGCLATMGFADTLEGYQDVIYGEYGLQEKSYNFVRDTVFSGNETAYFIAQTALGVISGVGAYKLVGYNSSKIIAAEMSKEVEIATKMSNEVAEDSFKMDLQLFADKGASNPKTYTPIEYEGTVKVGGEVRDVSRRVYQRNDIDWNYVDTNTGLTNLQRAQKGKPPIGSDGNAIQLHHLTQQESGSMVEILQSTHQDYYSQLHGLVGDGESFRNNPILDKQYNNFRNSYWKWRANQVK